MRRGGLGKWWVALAGAAAVAALRPQPALADTGSIDALKKLSFEELMGLEVTTVSRKPEKLTEAASAVQVITGEDIRRSGAVSIADALRLAPNLQVAQVNASQWAVSARGFNNVLANKLLVLIDGRTVYTPFYAGVFWDVQDVLLEDVDRIEVVSGPGSTLWGANAVNGVINIITKSAKDTQGAFVEGGAGGALNGFGSIRYGGETASGVAWRAYGKTTHWDDLPLHSTGESANDAWHLSQGGVRFDGGAGKPDSWTVQSDLYDGRSDPDGTNQVKMSGGNLLGRWQRALSDSSGLKVQVYYDHEKRDFGNGFAGTLSTWDLDAQHRVLLAQRHQVVWGADVRVMRHQVDNLPTFGFTPANKTLHLYSAFAQDEVSLVENVLHVTLGAKVERNDYTGTEWQPNARLTWKMAPQQTLWAALSRAVRTPSRLDREFAVSLLPGLPLIQGNPDFESEKVIAYELGWKLQTAKRMSLSLATFYNDYDKIRSAEPGNGPLGPPYPITLGNGVQGHTYGAELSVVKDLTDWWRLRGGYTWLEKRLEIAPGSSDLNGATAESDDPPHQALVQSTMDLPGGFQFDTVVRYVDQLPLPKVQSYVAFDARLAWRFARDFEIALLGRNLLDGQHLEFLPTSPAPRDIERSVFGRISWRH